MSATVLVVDDEREIAELLRDYLEAAGLQVHMAFDGEEALAVLANGTFDCVVLDVMMPGQNGFDVCRTLRAQDSDVPILFLSARQSDVDKIRGLGLGADDYVGKPFSPAEVVARVQALLRRYRRQGSAPEAVLHAGRLELDVKGYTAAIDGQPVSLTVKEFELLRFLAEHPGQVFTRDQLFDQIWGDFGDLHTVTVHIARIREKVGAQYIKTVWGVGYKFGGDGT